MKLNNPKHAAKTLAAMGIDPQTGDYEFDGTNLTVNGKTDAKIKAAEASLNIVALDAAEALATCRAKRAGAYPPMADYLDAIVKSDTVAQQAYIDACLAVKAKYPKP